MRPFHSITPRTVLQVALQTMVPLDIQDYKTVPKTFILRLLLQIASTGQSLYAAARFSRFSHETARKAVRSNLPELDILTARLNAALFNAACIPGRVRRRRAGVVAIDTHYKPCYGDKTMPGVVGGPRKAGTHHTYACATICIIMKGQRYTLGLIPILPKMKPHEIVATLLDMLENREFCIAGVALDAGFDSGETLLLLQERWLSYTVPLKRNNKGSNRRNVLFEQPDGHVDWAEWTTERSRRRVRTRVVVWVRNRKTRVYAFAGWNLRRVWLQAERAREWYRRRFGIETNYRQKNACQGLTTSRSWPYRLLLEGLAHLLRQVWVYLTGEIAAIALESGKKAAREWVSELPLQRMLMWLFGEVDLEDERIQDLADPQFALG